MVFPVAAARAEPATPITFRGDSRLQGNAAARLAPPLTLAWRFTTGDEITATPVISGTTVFVGSGDRNIYAIDAGSGRARWAFDTGAPVEAPVLFMNDTIYCGTANGAFFALCASNGTRRWQFDAGSKIAGAANGFSMGATNYVMVGSFNNTLYCLEAATGRLVWTNISRSYINGSPAIDQTRALYGSCDAYVRIVRPSDGATLHAYNAGTYIPGSPVIDGDHALIATYGGALIRYDIPNRRELWRYAPPNCSWFASPATDGANVIIGGHDRAIHCVAARDGSLRWKFMTGDQVDSSPLIVGTRVVAASDDGIVYLLDKVTGRELWRYDIGQPVKGAPAAYGQLLVIAASDGAVYAFSGT